MSAATGAGVSSAAATAGPSPLWDIKVKDILGKEHPIGDTIRGKVAVIVNVASKCGLTPQYAGLQKLQDDYGARGLVVVAFPCNQFMGQEPGDEASIQEFVCTRFKGTFPLFSKVEVNGAGTHPLYKYLKENKGSWLGADIKWNFAKFLIDREGNVVERYLPTTSPESMAKDIEKLL